jgi:hypothetical protein
MSELSLSRFRLCFFSKLRIGTSASRFSPVFKLGQALRSDVAQGSEKKVLKIVPKCAILPSFVSPLSALFCLILTYVYTTEWSVAAAGAAPRPVAMQIADRSAVLLACVPAPQQGFPIGTVCGESTVY